MPSQVNFAILSLVLALLGCQTVEYTSPSQVNLVSEDQEIKLGFEAYQDILKQTPKSPRNDLQTQLRRVGQRIAGVANKPEYQWEFNVLHGKEINAFALPGGKVAFWEGIMPITGMTTALPSSWVTRWRTL